MCIYCGTNKYRKIYESHNGPIPKEDNGRSYEIHHIDGNHFNNDPSNLKAVSIQEHYDIHYSQGDWAACLIISDRAKISSKEQSGLSRKTQLKKLSEGRHHFKPSNGSPTLGALMVERGDHPFLNKENAKNRNIKRVLDKTHNFLGQKNPTHQQIKKGIHHFQTNNPSKVQVLNGTHHFLTNHPNKVKVICPHCNKIGGKVNMNRYHFGNCKLLKNI